jgi:GT2 family glycosyltransferase
MHPAIIPVSAILPTRNRAVILSRFFDSLEKQDAVPAEIVVCDGSDDSATMAVIAARETAWLSRFNGRVRWIAQKADQTGLAPQRNQAVAAATQPFVWFLDDDMILEPGCVRNLYDAIASDPEMGGVTATLVNEPYNSPGRMTRSLMKWFEHGIERDSYASACVGPGWTFLHEASFEGPPLMRAEWLGGGCTLYRKSALPVPAVPAHFEGGAFGEDLAAALSVARHWKIYHVRAARAIHDSQAGDHKRSARLRADQGLRNRYFIMTRVMGKTSLRDQFDFALMFAFNLLSIFSRPGQWRLLLPIIVGHLQGIWKLIVHPLP